MYLKYLMIPGNTWKKMGAGQQEIRANLKEYSMSETGTNWAIFLMTILDYET